MTAQFDEEALRNWLADYLVTTIGCSPADIDFEASVNDLGVGSRDAVVLCGELSLLAAQTNPGELMAAHDKFERRAIPDAAGPHGKDDA